MQRRSANGRRSQRSTVRAGAVREPHRAGDRRHRGLRAGGGDDPHLVAVLLEDERCDEADDACTDDGDLHGESIAGRGRLRVPWGAWIRSRS